MLNNLIKLQGALSRLDRDGETTQDGRLIVTVSDFLHPQDHSWFKDMLALRGKPKTHINLQFGISLPETRMRSDYGNFGDTQLLIDKTARIDLDDPRTRQVFGIGEEDDSDIDMEMVFQLSYIIVLNYFPLLLYI